MEEKRQNTTQRRTQDAPRQHPQSLYATPTEHYRYPYVAYGYHVSEMQQYHYHMMAQQYGYQYPLQHMEGVPLPPGIPGLGGSTDPLEAVLGPFPCAKLKNLPYDASLEDILLLFQGLVVIDVILVGHGEAFVIFANPMDYQMGLQRDRQPLGRQFVEISAASRDQYYSAIAQHIQEQEGGRPLATAIGSVAGLGDEGNRDNQIARGGDAGSAGSALWTGASGSPSTTTLAAAAAYSDSMAPHQQQHYHPQMQQGGHAPPHLGGPMGMPGRVGVAGPPRVVGAGGMHAPLLKRTGGGIQVGEHTGFLRMRGLPFSAAKDDIYHFFEGYNPIQESIVLTYRNDGRATGEAYIAFASPEDAKRAMDLHRRSMGSRYIELFISNKDEQGRALARFGSR